MILKKIKQTIFLIYIHVTVEVTPSVAACQDSTTFINITNTKYIKEDVENITQALYVDKKTMSSYVRSKTCEEDDRPSSATVGYVGIVFIVVHFGLMIILDLRTVYTHIRDSVRQCKTRTKEKKVTPVVLTDMKGVTSE